MNHGIRLLITLLLLHSLAAAYVLAADPEPAVTPAVDLARKWKRTKSIVPPTERLRKGLEIETAEDGEPAASQKAHSVEVTVDADSGASFRNIQFEFNSASLSGVATFSQLMEIAEAMKMAGSEKFLIEGHTCDLGSEEENLLLSFHRAMAVRDALTGLGVAGDRLQVLGFGEQEPALANVDEASRSMNRRVQVFRTLQE